MRDIKFRAWNPRWDEFVYSHNNYIFEKREFSPFEFQVGFSHYPQDDEWTIEQFTGMKDGNGKEIWEGDILKITPARENPFYAVVVYDEQKGQFCVIDEDLAWGLSSNDKHNIVVGNIHENSEFLKGKST